MENQIIKAENINLIVKDAPQAYKENGVSRDRCIEYGKTLLAKIQASGMTDELDQEAKVYIDKARATIKKMNEKRSPYTKLFDEIRASFTAYENEIDPNKDKTIPCQIQQLRNQFAAAKREEEQRKQRELALKHQQELAKVKYEQDLRQGYANSANEHMCNANNKLTVMMSKVTLANYDDSIHAFTTFDYPFELLVPNVIKPSIVPLAELNDIQAKVVDECVKMYTNKINDYIEETKKQFLDVMPSKKSELERAAQASAEEAENIREQMKQREAEEAARKAAELQEQQEAARKADEMKSQAVTMGNLFDGAAAGMPAYAPKASVKKTLVPLNVEAFPLIISMWWQNEGCNMTTEELCKMFKKQITFCEKRAKEGELIQSEHIEYVDEVKAK